MPQYAPLSQPGASGATVNFTGRLTNALRSATDYARTVYAPEFGGWFHPNGIESAGLNMFGILNKSVGVAGLCGMDRLLSFRIVHDLRSLLSFMTRDVKSLGLLDLFKVRHARKSS